MGAGSGSGTEPIGYLGPEGTFTHEALLASLPGGPPSELVAFPTIYDTVMAVHGGAVGRALVPIENSLEGSVNATLDTLVLDTEDVAIVGEVVFAIEQCLIARRPMALSEVTVVVSHAQANAQCARFVRTELPQARVMAAASTAHAVMRVAEQDEPWAALGNRLAAEQYGCVVLRDAVQDAAENQTRFVWLARAAEGSGGLDETAGAGSARKTAIVFWGVGSEAPGWLVRCLSELADRRVNMTRIESRPLKRELGSYMFFVDLEGSVEDTAVAEGLARLRRHVEVLRVLGSYPVP